jgi:flagellar basal body-associated protein FliL
MLKKRDSDGEGSKSEPMETWKIALACFFALAAVGLAIFAFWLIRKNNKKDNQREEDNRRTAAATLVPRKAP